MSNIKIYTKLLLIVVLCLSSALLFSAELDMIDGEDIQVNIVLTHPAGYSPKVFTTGWIFGAYATAKVGNEPEKDISNQVQWSGSGTFLPATGPVSRPSFSGQGGNTIKITVTVNEQVFAKEFTVNAIYPWGYAAIGTTAFCAADAHGCDKGCPHSVQGPIITGSPNVTIDGIPAARKGDTGVHAACCGPNTFEIAEGDGSVLINGRPAARIGSKTIHCGGIGQIGLPPGGGTDTELEKNCDEDKNEVWNEEGGDCVCIDGYLPNQAGKCIEVEDCPEENSHFDVNALSSFGACVCDDGYSHIYSLRDNKCYKIPECDESNNKVFDYWNGGCKCKDGYKENDEGVCVKICNEENNEVWDKLREKCICKDGFKKNILGKCVSICNEKDNNIWSDEEGDCICNEGYKANLAGECIEIKECDDSKKYFSVEQEECICNEIEGYYPTEDPDICSRFTAIRFEPNQFEGPIGEVVSFKILGIDQSGSSISIRSEEIEITQVGRYNYDRIIDGHQAAITIIGIECDTATEYWNNSERRCDCKEDRYERNEYGKCVPVEDEEEDEEAEEEIIDECSIEYLKSLSSLLEILIADTKQYEAELLSYMSKFNKEINDQSSDPCKNSIIAYCYYSAVRIAGVLQENSVDIYDLAIDIIILQETCSDLNQQMQAEGLTDKSLISSIDGLGSYEEKLNQMKTRLQENGCDEDEVEQDGEKVVPNEEDPGFLQDGGTSTEMPGDGDDNDGDGQQDEEPEGLTGYNVTLVLYDSGSAKDDVFNLSVQGYGNLGQTPAGGLRSYGLNLPPGSYIASVSVVVAPDNVGTYTLTALFNGTSIGSISGSPPQGSSATLVFTVPIE